jgi:MFS family permease
LAPRDALVADSIGPSSRGLVFGLHRAADTGGAVLGLLVAIAVVVYVQGNASELGRETFRTLVLVSLVPAFLAVLTVALGVKEGRKGAAADAPRIGFRGLGRRFAVFLAIVGLFDLGNFSDAFLVLRAQERGLGVEGVLWTLVGFNLVYALVATPAGALSDRIGRRRIITIGWIAYAGVYLGFALAGSGTEIVALYLCYGAYYGLTMGTAKAMVADLVPARLRGTAYGSYHALLGVINLPASLIAGLLWQGIGSWQGFGPAAPFYFGAGTALAAALLLAAFLRDAGEVGRGAAQRLEEFLQPTAAPFSARTALTPEQRAGDPSAPSSRSGPPEHLAAPSDREDERGVCVRLLMTEQPRSTRRSA